MYCLTGIGGQVASVVKTTHGADQILAIDGCTLNCASLCLKEAGFEDFATLSWRSWAWKKECVLRPKKASRAPPRLAVRILAR